MPPIYDRVMSRRYDQSCPSLERNQPVPVAVCRQANPFIPAGLRVHAATLFAESEALSARCRAFPGTRSSCSARKPMAATSPIDIARSRLRYVARPTLFVLRLPASCERTVGTTRRYSSKPHGIAVHNSHPAQSDGCAPLLTARGSECRFRTGGCGGLGISRQSQAASSVALGLAAP